MDATSSLDRLAGAAGLGYVVLAGVENMELLGAPLPGAPAAEIRAAYATARWPRSRAPPACCRCCSTPPSRSRCGAAARR